MSALDFSGLLQAVEQLIQSHGNKSKYSEVIDAKIVAKNGDVYTVQAGNDEFSAKAIDGTSSYPLESLVCVLITNNTQASVINYILGLKEQDSSKDYSSLYYRVIAEVTDSVVTSSNEVVLLASKGWGEIILYQKDGEDNKITLQETDDFKFFIREYGILKMRGSFKNTFSPTNIGKGTFGLKIDINFGDSESKNYLISNYDMLGDPYRYKDYSEQELSFELGELYKQNFNYIEKISFYAIDFTAEEGEQGDSISLTDISIYAGELQSIIKDLKLELKVASAPVDSFYGDSSTVTLQANLTSENGGSYNFSEMRYFWFIKDTSVNSQSEYFSSIAGAGWRCLNQKMPYEVNGVTYQNWIGTTDDLFILTKENAPSRKNTYKCFGVYKGDVSKSRNLISNEIEIINYNKVDFILNIESTSMNFETLDDSITLTAVVSASPQPKTGYEYFYEYKWFEAGVEMMDETDVSITVQPKEKSPIQTYSCKVDCYSKDTSTDEKIFLATIEKEISLNNLTADGELITETVYYCKETTAAPDAPEKDMVYGDGEGKDNWNTNNSIESPASKYRFKSERKVLLKKAEDGKREWAGYEKDSEDQGKYYRKEEDNIYYYSTKGEGDTYIFTLETMDSNPTDWSNPVCDYVSGAYNLETAVAQLNIFNQLTENGKDDGIYYSENDEMGYQLTKD